MFSELVEATGPDSWDVVMIVGVDTGLLGGVRVLQEDFKARLRWVVTTLIWYLV